MLNRWNDSHAARCIGDLALRAYSSRLLGADPALVLHGGGNTSVKLQDGAEQTLWVKGSGSDLAQVTDKDFTPLALDPVRALLRNGELNNDQMMAALAPCVREAGRPKPSIETLLHAALPFRFVEHTHADAVLAVTNTHNGEAIAARIFGDLAPLVPFRHSGFDLAKASFEVFQREHTARTIGLILLQHGVFAFGNTAREAYENMLKLVGLAEDYLRGCNAWTLPNAPSTGKWTTHEIATLRAQISRAAGFPLLARVHDDAHTVAFARHLHLAEVLQEGPATPQHAVFIKRLPMIGRDVSGYAEAYRVYVHGRADAPDPAPRVVLDEVFGALVLGFGPDYLQITDDIFRHGREIMTRASAHDRYRGLPAEAILDAEIHYGGFERRLLEKGEDKDRLRGLCIAFAVDDVAFGESLRSALSSRGAAVLNLQSEASVEQLVAQYGGLDAFIASPSQQRRIDAYVSLLECAPLGGKLLWLSDAAPPITTGIQSIAVRSDLAQILNTLTV